MKIELSEDVLDIIDSALTEYCAEYDNQIYATAALGALRNAIANAKAFEQLKDKIKNEYPGLDTSIADFMDDRINEIVQKGQIDKRWFKIFVIFFKSYYNWTHER